MQDYLFIYLFFDTNKMTYSVWFEWPISFFFFYREFGNKHSHEVKEWFGGSVVLVVDKGKKEREWIREEVHTHVGLSSVMSSSSSSTTCFSSLPRLPRPFSFPKTKPPPTPSKFLQQQLCTYAVISIDSSFTHSVVSLLYEVFDFWDTT